MAGYNIYRGLTRDTIDYTTPVGAAGVVSSLELAQTDLAANTEYWYCIRAETNRLDLANDVFIKIKTDANGEYVPRPNSPLMLKAYPLSGNTVQLTWNYSTLEESAAVSEYVIYWDSGTGIIDYTYANRLDTSTVLDFTTGALSDGSYLFSVRARSAAGNEDNNFDEVATVVNDAGPADISAILLSVGF